MIRTKPSLLRSAIVKVAQLKNSIKTYKLNQEDMKKINDMIDDTLSYIYQCNK